MTASILIVEDDFSLGEALKDTLELVGHRTFTADDGSTAMQVLENENIDLIVSDVQMKQVDGIQLLKRISNKYPDKPVILMTAYGTIQQAVVAIQAGAVDYLVKPFEPEVLVARVSQFLPSSIPDDDGMIAVDKLTMEIFSLARKVAKSDATVLVTGESGTGKEVLVQHIHRHSDRSKQAFVAINCAAIPDNMLEAILFGYQKGAFTGAYKSCPGKFEQAQGGTLLLDEISEMSLGLQAKLLRVLQEREVERLGDQKLIPLDVRVMATSNRNMQEEVTRGHFREDLYYRLNVFNIEMPALRDRPDDISSLAEFLLQRVVSKNQSIPPRLSDDALLKLETHQWPGNVRELDNVMQRALIMHSNGIIRENDLQFENLRSADEVEIKKGNIELPETLGSDLRVQERQTILKALTQSRGSRKTAAETLGISPRTLRYKLARMREEGVAIPG
ncbi:MAG: two-component system response regulator FlrC [Planctomycetota bacterium]|jgi:two-component system response regulator FlrC